MNFAGRIRIRERLIASKPRDAARKILKRLALLGLVAISFPLRKPRETGLTATALIQVLRIFKLIFSVGIAFENITQLVVR